MNSLLLWHIIVSRPADCIVPTNFSNIKFGISDRIRGGNPYKAKTFVPEEQELMTNYSNIAYPIWP
jgi:hypothetical protein